MKDGIYAVGFIGALIITAVAIYSILSGNLVDEVEWPFGARIKFRTPTPKITPTIPAPSPTASKTPQAKKPIRVSPAPTPEQTPQPIPTPEQIDISGEWRLIDTTSRNLRLVIQQNQNNNLEMRVYEWNGVNTWTFQGIINGNNISGNFIHYISRTQGRANLEVSSDGTKITGSLINSARIETPFLARR